MLFNVKEVRFSIAESPRCEMTFFHEIGHSMNADHDNADEFQDRKDECNPSDTNGGSYLMYASSTEGLLPNNRAYSHCSLDSISYVYEYGEIIF